MKGKILKKVIAAALVLTLVSGGVPVQPIAEYLNPAITASAAEYTQNPTTKDELVPLASSGTVSEAHVVKYANKEWYVIGYDGVGLASESGTMTLFLKGTLGKRSFSDNGSNVYGNSSIHSYLESYLANTKNFTSDESGAVVSRVLSGGGSTGNSYSGHVSGDSVNAKLWLLSAAEARKIPQSIIKSGGDGDGWWLRSPGGGSGKANYMPVSPFGNDVPKEQGADIGSSKSIRAAMLLDLNSVIYSSETNTLIAQEAESHSITVSLDNDQGSVEAPPRADKGETVSFTIATAVGYEVDTVKFNDTPISPLNGVYSFTMPDNDVTISVTFNQIYKVEDHIEQDGDTYTIKTAKGWEVFCDCVKSSAYNGFWNKTVKLGLDITDGVTVSAGIPGKPFFGTFDGDGHTLAVALNSTDEEWVAPFSFFNGSIKNLTVIGTIAGSTYAAGLTGFTYGGSIENVTVSADVSGSSKIGGITGYSDFGSLLVKDTVFNGTLQCNKDVCGLIGWASENVGYNQAITIENCLFNGTYTCDGEFHPITLRNSNSQFAYTDNGAYYTVDPSLSNNNYIICAGTRVSTITVDDDFKITANPTFTFNSVDYYAEGTTITLSRVGSVTGVSVNNGSVEVTDNQDGTYSFTMPAEDVSINGHFSINIDSTIHHGSVTVTVGTTENAVAANEGDTVTLTVTPDKNYVFGSLTVRDSSNNVIEVNNNQFTMPASDVTVSATFTPDSAHFSQSGDTYTIHDAAGWGVFCDFIEGGETFSGKTVKLDADITVTRMAGKCDPNNSANDRVFKGVFDGNHKTLTFSATAANNYVAPFAYLDGTESAHASISDLNVKTTITGEDYRHLAGLVAVHTGYVDITNCNADVSISCLKGDNNPSDLYPTGLVSQSSGTLTVNGCTVTGNIATNGKYASGLVGIVQKKAEIKNCLSSVTIKSSTSGDGTHGGLVGVTASNSTTTIEGCVFGGKLLTVGENDTGNCGGILGWKNANVTISNTLYAPAGLESGETEVVAGTGNNPSGTFYRGNAPTLTNCYYTRTLGTAQGKAAHTITAGQDVTVALGGEAANYKNYDVSGISTYGTALAYNGTIYAGNGDSVSLTLGHNTPTGYSTAFTASAGTLENGVLTMPDSNVVISAADTQNDYTITKSAEHGTMTVTVGETQNATTAHYGDTVTLTVTPDEHYQVKSVTVNGGAVAVTSNNDGTYSFTMPDGDVTVSAEFELQKHTVNITGEHCTIIIKDSNGVVIANGSEVSYGTKVTYEAVADQGYYIGSHGTKYKTETITVDGDINKTLSMGIVRYTVSAITHDAATYCTYSPTVSGTGTVAYGEEVIFTAYEAKEGYEFIGWYYSNGKLVSTEFVVKMKITSTTSLYARYRQKSGVVTFMSNGQQQGNEFVYTDTAITEADFPTNISALYGYQFTGWDKTVEQINADLKAGKNVTVTAQFAPIQNNFTVTIQNGKTNETVDCTESTLITRVAESVEGKTFAYWRMGENLFTNNPKISFTANETCTITAVYTNNNAEAQATAAINKVNFANDNLIIKAGMSVPDGMEIVSVGIKTSSNSDMSEAIETTATTSNNPAEFAVTKTDVAVNAKVYAQAYFTYNDENGIAQTKLGEIMEITAGQDYDADEKGTATIRSAIYNADTKKATFNAYLTVPENAVIVKAGLVAAPSTKFDPTSAVLTDANARFVKSLASAEGTSDPVNYTWNLNNVNADITIYARAYLVYILNGEQHTVYGLLTQPTT